MMSKKINFVGGVILIMLIVLVFFSNTVYSYNIPLITGVMPKNGKLEKKESSVGVADWADIEEIYVELSGKIEELYISEGDIVYAGQEIAKLVFDTDEINQKLNSLEIDKNKLDVSVESTNLRIEKLSAEISELENEEYELDELSEYEIIQIENKIKKAEDALSRVQKLHEAGGTTKQELDNAENELNSLILDYEKLLETRGKSQEQSIKSVDDKEKNRAKQIADKKYEIETLHQDIKSKSLDIQKNKNDQNTLRSQLADYNNNAYILAPADGRLISINIKKGQIVNKNQLAASFGVGSTFIITCNISRTNNFVAVGDTCKLSNTDHYFTAEVSKLEPSESNKEVTIRIESVEITAGETFDIDFTKESAKSAVLVPNGAINKDSDGYYVYYIKKRKGILGDEFYASKVPVYIGDSDDSNTIITNGITFFEPIILLGDKPFSENDTVRLKNEGDFFDN